MSPGGRFFCRLYGGLRNVRLQLTNRNTVLPVAHLKEGVMANKNKLRHKNSKSVLKTGLILVSVIGVITFLIISYLIYSLQCYAYDNNISSDNLNLSVLIKSMPYWTNPTFTAPFDIGAIMQMHGSVWYIYIVVLSLLSLMLFSKNYDDYKGVEAGSADWATKRDEKENSDETGIPIGNKFYVTVNNPQGRYYEPHNLNEILIGGPGAGKTFRKIKPDIIQMYGSYVVTDPKGELYRDTAKLLMENGYKVRVFNLINIKKTNASVMRLRQLIPLHMIRLLRLYFGLYA